VDDVAVHVQLTGLRERTILAATFHAAR
jgi:hypothetical protein